MEGRLTPESDEGGHLTEASGEGLTEEGNDREAAVVVTFLSKV